MSFIVNRSILRLLFFVIALVNTQVERAEAGAKFPIYPLIRSNVLFWEKIYGTYDSNQGVLHDKNDLNIIYAVIDLSPRGAPGARTINDKLIQLIRLRHKNILEKFASGKKPGTQEEKNIFSLFKEKNFSSSFRQASENLRLQTGLKNAFKQGVIRSGAYMPLIRKIMRARNLPVELAYLPHVESSFNLNAYSKAAAVGLWQFTKYTGREYMTVNDLVDERFDVYLSSRAAARFLKENHRQLGAWPLALTAYNYGRAGMVRAQKQWGTYPSIITNHKTGIFKFASKNFYSEFIAAVRVARRLENDRSLVKNRPWINVTFRLRGYAAAKALRKYFNVGKDDFQRLNPALRQPILDGRKYIPQGTLIRLPATKRIRQRIKKMPARLFHKNQIPTKEYKVRKGDTAGSIAGKFNISRKMLVQANQLDSKARIRKGQKLKIPSRGDEGSVSKVTGKQDKVITLQATAKQKTTSSAPDESGSTASGISSSKDSKDKVITLKQCAKRKP